MFVQRALKLDDSDISYSTLSDSDNISKRFKEDSELFNTIFSQFDAVA